MFRSIRRKDREIPESAAKQLLREARRGILAVNGEDGYPYCIPINYFYDEAHRQIVFHSSRAGYKVECLSRSDKVCFTVYGNESIRKETWAPFLQSAVVFGHCRPVADKETAMSLLKQFAMKYYPEESIADRGIAKSGAAVQVYAISIEYLTGKEVQEK